MSVFVPTMCVRCHQRSRFLTLNRVGHAYCPQCKVANGGRHFHASEAAEVAVTFEKGQEPLLLCRHHWNVSKAKIFELNPYDISEKE
jgi:hypothetical protein